LLFAGNVIVPVPEIFLNKFVGNEYKRDRNFWTIFEAANNFVKNPLLERCCEQHENATPPRELRKPLDQLEPKTTK